MKVYGLIGKTLSHSFSQRYFSQKFKEEGIRDHEYRLFELPTIQDFVSLSENAPSIRGFNVTIPYKEEILPYLDNLDPVAERIEAVNVIKIETDGKLTGYNSDYFGFRRSLEMWANTDPQELHALVLGTGGAAKAVWTVLDDMGVVFRKVSRATGRDNLNYEQLKMDPDLIRKYHLIVNTTPLGTYPNTDVAPDLDYSEISDQHYLYDLIYNPEMTVFLKNGLECGAKIKNGQEMLELQAEKSWEIWNS